jgi:hypothetical protein
MRLREVKRGDADEQTGETVRQCCLQRDKLGRLRDTPQPLKKCLDRGPRL